MFGRKHELEHARRRVTHTAIARLLLRNSYRRTAQQEKQREQQGLALHLPSLPQTPAIASDVCAGRAESYLRLNLGDISCAFRLAFARRLRERGVSRSFQLANASWTARSGRLPTPRKKAAA